MLTQEKSFSQNFADRHPETGEIQAGSILTSEQAVALGDVFERKLLDISRQPHISFADISFMDTVADLGARNVSYSLDKGMIMPAETEADLHKHALTLANNAGVLPATVDRSDVAQILPQLTGGHVSAREQGFLQPNIEDFGMSTMRAFGDIAEASGGMKVDDYLAGNLENMLMHYEFTEKA